MAQFFQDDQGQFSSMRIMAFVVVTLVLAVWVWGNIQAGQYVSLGYSEAGIITAAVGGKAIQSRFEGMPGRYDYRSDNVARD